MLAMLSQEVLGQWQDVFAPVAQRGQMDFDRIQAEQQILPKSTLRHFGI